jgi:hypothetical protein
VIIAIAIIVVVDWVESVDSVRSSQADGLTDVQRVRRPEGEDRSVSGSIRRGFAECRCGSDGTVMSPATAVLVCTFVFPPPPFTIVIVIWLVGFWRDNPHCARVFSFTRFLDHTKRRATVGRMPLDE